MGGFAHRCAKWTIREVCRLSIRDCPATRQSDRLREVIEGPAPSSKGAGGKALDAGARRRCGTGARRCGLIRCATRIGIGPEEIERAGADATSRLASLDDWRHRHLAFAARRCQHRLGVALSSCRERRRSTLGPGGARRRRESGSRAHPPESVKCADLFLTSRPAEVPATNHRFQHIAAMSAPGLSRSSGISLSTTAAALDAAAGAFLGRIGARRQISRGSRARDRSQAHLEIAAPARLAGLPTSRCASPSQFWFLNAVVSSTLLARAPRRGTMSLFERPFKNQNCNRTGCARRSAAPAAAQSAIPGRA